MKNKRQYKRQETFTQETSDEVYKGQAKRERNELRQTDKKKKTSDNTKDKRVETRNKG